MYPLFCRALHVVPVPFKDFARELKTAMSKKRRSRWKDGKRVGATKRYYVVRHPTAKAVEIAERKRA
jgi:hypothetical protein